MEWERNMVKDQAKSPSLSLHALSNLLWWLQTQGLASFGQTFSIQDQDSDNADQNICACLFLSVCLKIVDWAFLRSWLQFCIMSANDVVDPHPSYVKIHLEKENRDILYKHIRKYVERENRAFLHKLEYEKPVQSFSKIHRELILHINWHWAVWWVRVGIDKTFTTRWSGCRVQVWVHV